jgi:hypothetical protein
MLCFGKHPNDVFIPQFFFSLFFSLSPANAQHLIAVYFSMSKIIRTEKNIIYER